MHSMNIWSQQRNPHSPSTLRMSQCSLQLTLRANIHWFLTSFDPSTRCSHWRKSHCMMRSLNDNFGTGCQCSFAHRCNESHVYIHSSSQLMRLSSSYNMFVCWVCYLVLGHVRQYPSFPRAVHLHWVLQHQQNLRRGDQSKSTEKKKTQNIRVL